MQWERDLRTPSPKLDIFIKFLSSRFRKHQRREDRNDGGHQENMGTLNEHGQSICELTETEVTYTGPISVLCKYVIISSLVCFYAIHEYINRWISFVQLPLHFVFFLSVCFSNSIGLVFVLYFYFNLLIH